MVRFSCGNVNWAILDHPDNLLEEINTKGKSLETELYDEVQRYFTDWKTQWYSAGVSLEINQALRLAQVTVYCEKYIGQPNSWKVLVSNFPKEYLPPFNLRQLAYNIDTLVEINIGGKCLNVRSGTTGTKKLRTVFTYRYMALDAPRPDDPDPDDPEPNTN